MMNEEVVYGLVNDAMITGGIMGVCLTIAVGVFVSLVNSSRQRQTDRMSKLEDEVFKLKEFKRQVEMDKRMFDRMLKSEKTGVN